MPDDPKKRGKPDRDRVNIHQGHERSHAAKRFFTTQAHVIAGVKAVGPMVKDLKPWFIEQIEKA